MNRIVGTGAGGGGRRTEPDFDARDAFGVHLAGDNRRASAIEVCEPHLALAGDTYGPLTG